MEEDAGIISDDDVSEQPSLDYEIKNGTSEFFIEAEDLIKAAWFFRIALVERKR